VVSTTYLGSPYTILPYQWLQYCADWGCRTKQASVTSSLIKLLPLFSESHTFSYPVYYRLYTKDRPIMSNNPIYANNPFISHTLPKFVTPPCTALSIKKHLCKIEGLSAHTSSMLFESLLKRNRSCGILSIGFWRVFWSWVV